MCSCDVQFILTGDYLTVWDVDSGESHSAAGVGHSCVDQLRSVAHKNDDLKFSDRDNPRDGLNGLNLPPRGLDRD